MKRSMAWNPFKLIFLCFTFFIFATPQAKGADYLYRFCSEEDISSDNSSYQTSVRTLLSSLSSNATANANGFYNNTILPTNSSDTVYGLFMCRGDLLPHACNGCVASATQSLSSDANSLSKSVVIWYAECMVRYSNLSFFSTVDTTPSFYSWNVANISSNSSSFNSLLANTMRETADEAANSSKRYSAKQANLSEFQTLYCLTQCTQDLSFQQCSDCLDDAISTIPTCCNGKIGARLFFTSCNIRYELYPFYRVTDDAPQGLVPETTYAHTDSEYSEDPGYISHNCSNNNSDAAFRSNLRTLFSALSSNATSNYGFQSRERTAYGLFRCRIDIPSRLCELCIQNSTDKLTSECGFAYTDAIIWYNHCWLRYSHRNFFSRTETSSRFVNLNISNSNPIQSSVASELSNQLVKVADMTGKTDNKFYTDESLRLNDKQTVFILGQCSSDLSADGCSGCLTDVIGTAIPWSSLGSLGGRVILGSGSRSPLPWCCLRTLSEATLESARHVTQVPHPSCSGSLSPNGLRAPVIFSCARSGESTRRTPTLLKVEAPMTTPHTEREKVSEEQLS
ncbi:hypothetical protein PHAVU_008G077300 [Phaseolus vulgaris]